MSVTCLSSKATGLLAAWRNPYGKEEEQLQRALFSPRTTYPLKRLIKTGAAQAGFSLLALAASVETIAYAVLTALSFPWYLGSNRPNFCLELLKSSSFTTLWAIFELYRGCYMVNDPMINTPTRESFARMQLEDLGCLTSVYPLRRQDRTEIIKQVLPSSSKRFIDFCIRDDMWAHLKRNILNVSCVLPMLCQDSKNPNASDDLKELHITNICRISSDSTSSSDGIAPYWCYSYKPRLSYYSRSIEILKHLNSSLLQLHLKNVKQLCSLHPELLGDYFSFIESIPFPSSTESNADLSWVEGALEEIYKKSLISSLIHSLEFKEYLMNLNQESSVHIQLGEGNSLWLSSEPIILWVK